MTKDQGEQAMDEEYKKFEAWWEENKHRRIKHTPITIGGETLKDAMKSCWLAYAKEKDAQIEALQQQISELDCGKHNVTEANQYKPDRCLYCRQLELSKENDQLQSTVRRYEQVLRDLLNLWEADPDDSRERDIVTAALTESSNTTGEKARQPQDMKSPKDGS